MLRALALEGYTFPRAEDWPLDGDLTFYGGIGTQRVLPFVSSAEVKIVVGEMIKRVGQGGGYIIAPAYAMRGTSRPRTWWLLGKV